MLPQLLELLQATESGVPLERLQLLDLVLQDGDDLLLLLLGQSQLDGELVGDFRQRVHRDLRRRNDLVVGIAELVAARAVIGVSQFVERQA